MKKAIIRCVLGWIVLALMIAGLYAYGMSLEVTMEPPEAQLVVGKNGQLTIKWESVEYASSYRLYRTNEVGGWELIEAVGNDIYSFDMPEGSSVESTYAVRSCNTSLRGTTLSEYSKVVPVEE